MSIVQVKRRFGQHFLKSQSLAEKIVARLDIKPGDEIVEIGPGRGALTEQLIGDDRKLTVIEIDKALCRRLRNKFGESDNLRILNLDFLDFDENLLPARFKVIGNIPYNRTAGILGRLIELVESIELGIITVQAEVAEKLVARPKSRAYGLLTVLTATAFECEKLFTIHPGAFSPAPKVRSAVVKLKPHHNRDSDSDEFRSFLKACFFSPRKLLINSLCLSLKLSKNEAESLVARYSRNAAVRAADLDLDTFRELFFVWRAECRD